MRTARRLSQIVFLSLYVLLFLLAAYPLTSKLPVDLFLRMDPLLGLASTIAERSFFIKMVPSLILLAFTVVFGRFFCGWVCPLGTTIDGSDNALKAKSLGGKEARGKWIKFSVLTVVILAAVLSIQLAGFVDPIPLLTRSIVVFLYPLFAVITDGFFGLLMSISFLEDAVFNLHNTLRGTLLPVNMLAFRSSIIVAFIFISILALAKAHRRFWCRNLCPLGALYGLAARFRPYKRRVTDACTSCGLCRRTCRMDAIGPDFTSTDHVECISCMDCVTVCPVNAVHFGFTRERAEVKPDYNRRRLLTAGAAGLFSVGLLKIGFTRPEKKGKVVRPPGSMEEPDFLDRCIRCGECIRVCSTSGAGLQYTTLEAGWEGIWTPILMPKVGYCEYNCNMCGQICPTGAIRPLPLDERKEMKMGTAHFDKTRCIPWYYGENCMVCEEHCPLPEKAIQFRESSVVTIDGQETTVLLPYVEESVCIGCGICVNRCPVEGDRGIYLTNADETRWFV